MGERRAKRFESKDPVPVTVTGIGIHFNAPMADISANGIRINCKEKVEPGTHVQLIIGKLPHGVHVTAVVRRRLHSGVALEFRYLSATDRELLRKLLVRLSAATIED